MCKVALVDDDPIYLFIAKRMLERAGLEGKVLVFNNGKEVFSWLLSHIEVPNQLPQSIFLDINMPQLNGWEFLEEFATVNDFEKYSPNIYIVSSSVDERDRKKAVTNPLVKDYITKPITMDTISKLLL